MFYSDSCVRDSENLILKYCIHRSSQPFYHLFMQGRFEILSLSGSFFPSESSGQRSRTGGLSVLLAGPDGRVLGGGVAGLLTAASSVQVLLLLIFSFVLHQAVIANLSYRDCIMHELHDLSKWLYDAKGNWPSSLSYVFFPEVSSRWCIGVCFCLQIIVGSFISEEWKESRPGINQPETMYGPGASIAGSPTSRGTFSESSGGPGSPPNQSTGGCNSNPQGMPNVPWK